MIDRLYRRFLMPRIALFRQRLKTELRSELKAELKAELKTELKAELKAELKTELKTELKAELKSELKSELRSELTAELTARLTSRLTGELELRLLLDPQHSAILADMRARTEDAARQERAAHWIAGVVVIHGSIVRILYMRHRVLRPWLLGEPQSGCDRGGYDSDIGASRAKFSVAT